MSVREDSRAVAMRRAASSSGASIPRGKRPELLRLGLDQDSRRAGPRPDEPKRFDRALVAGDCLRLDGYGGDLRRGRGASLGWPG